MKELIISANTSISDLGTIPTYTLVPGGKRGRVMDISTIPNGDAKTHASPDHIKDVDDVKDVIYVKDDDVIVEIDSLECLMNSSPPLLQNKCCIYRVSSKIYRLNEKVYTPQVVSIGPFHHGKKELHAMEEQKLRYLESFLDHTKLSLIDCTTAITEWEEQARGCYSETINLTSEQFRLMLLLDSCFLMETILKGDADPTVMRDLVLLENQLPFFILDGLYELVLTSNPRKETFLELCVIYFTKIMLLEKTRNMVNIASSHEVKHLLDLLRLCHLPSTPRLVPVSKVPKTRISCARDLQEAGIKFWRGSRDHLLDIKYTSSGVLEIPQVIIEGTSECLLRNLLALERLHYTFETYITDYICFMDKLMNGTKDVEILIQNDIIRNWIGNASDVATLFHSLGSEVSTWWPAYYYAKMSEDLNSYCMVRRSWWNAGIIRDFLSNPRMMVITILATLLLIYTYEQFLYSIIFYGI